MYNPSLLDSTSFAWINTESWQAIWIVFSFITGTVTAMLMFQVKEWVVDILGILEVEEPGLIEAYYEKYPDGNDSSTTNDSATEWTS